MQEARVREHYEYLTKYLIEHSLTITTMESMTCGQIASLITDTEGASAILKGAFITYSNEAKLMQQVPAEVIDKFGVYSIETAREMAYACKHAYGADIGIGVTGTAGNVDPSNADSVPGEVYIAVVIENNELTKRFEMPLCNSRYAYKLCAAEYVYELLVELLGLYSKK